MRRSKFLRIQPLNGVITSESKKKVVKQTEINDYVDRSFYLFGKNRLKYLPITNKSKF